MLPMMVAAEETAWSISGMLSDVVVIFSKAFELIQANPVAAAFVGISLAGAGIGLFGRTIHVGR